MNAQAIQNAIDALVLDRADIAAKRTANADDITRLTDKRELLTGKADSLDRAITALEVLKTVTAV